MTGLHNKTYKLLRDFVSISNWSQGDFRGFEPGPADKDYHIKIGKEK